jgi:hypothetical protein
VYLVIQQLIIHFATYSFKVSSSAVNCVSYCCVWAQTLVFSCSFQFAGSPTWLMRKLVTVLMFGGSALCPLSTVYILFNTLVSLVHSGTMCKNSSHDIMVFSILQKMAVRVFNLHPLTTCCQDPLVFLPSSVLYLMFSTGDVTFIVTQFCVFLMGKDSSIYVCCKLYLSLYNEMK